MLGFTAEEEAVVRRAAARMIRYDRYHQRMLRRKPGRGDSSCAFQGRTAEEALDAYTKDLHLWHELANAACDLVQEVTGRERRPRA